MMKIMAAVPLFLFLALSGCSTEGDGEQNGGDGDDDGTSNYENSPPDIENLMLDCGGVGSTGVSIDFDFTDPDGDVQGGEVYIKYRFNSGDRQEARLAVPEDVTGTSGRISVFLAADGELSPGDRYDIEVRLLDAAGLSSWPEGGTCTVVSV